jgi:hypothetical protein
MAKQGWIHFFLYKATENDHLQMTTKEKCSSIIWVNKQTDLHKALVVARDMRNGMLVTNMAKDMIAFVEKTFLEPYCFNAEETLWIYRDSVGRWDRMLPKRANDRIEVNFEPVGDRTVMAAKSAITTHGFDVTEYPLHEVLQERLQ